ncbi:nucleotidyltransferase family protein [Methanoculleus sp.]|uniref:nucleotidyltransferase family protein n=1 Tax=Methanoculleus sp. TaxID=90427 RepID=UPI002FC5B380
MNSWRGCGSRVVRGRTGQGPDTGRNHPRGGVLFILQPDHKLRHPLPIASGIKLGVGLVPPDDRSRPEGCPRCRNFSDAVTGGGGKFIPPTSGKIDWNSHVRHARSDPEERSRILAIAGQHGPTNLRIFGSVARGEAGPESDQDHLVDLEPGRSLLDHIALIQDLEEALGCRVDVMTETALKERYKKRVLKEAVPL